MGVQKDFYIRRIMELESLLKKSTSKASRHLLEEAIQLTHRSFSECERISKLASEKIVFYESKKKKFDEALKKMDEIPSRLNAASTLNFLSQDTKEKVLSASEAIATDIQILYSKQVSANLQLRSAIDQCSNELRDTLVELIYKPHSSKFIRDSVISIVKKIVTSLIPYSDKVELILETNINARKKNISRMGTNC